MLTVTLDRDADRRGGEGLPRPQLILVMEADDPLAPSSRHSLEGVSSVTIGRWSVRDVERQGNAPKRRLVLRVRDPAMSSQHATMVYEDGGWAIEDGGEAGGTRKPSKNGVFLNGDRIQRARLDDGDLVEMGHTFFLYRMAPIAGGSAPDLRATELPSPAESLNGGPSPRPSPAGGRGGPDGARSAAVAPPAAAPSPASGSGEPDGALKTFNTELAGQFAAIGKVAASSMSVLILGPTGTGKEGTARAVHALSPRGKGPFLAINCGAVPEGTIAGELLGAKRGAYTGLDRDRKGYFEAADGGTLLLDEIGDLPMAAQVVLLRVLQEKEVVPLGGTTPVKVDVRVVAATHHDLPELVRTGRFREDLYARLAAHVVTLPPLSERLEDLGLLVAALLGQPELKPFSKVSFSPEAARAFFLYDWPRNVRELRNVLGVSAALAGGGKIEIGHLPEALQQAVEAPPSRGDRENPLSDEDAKLRHELLTRLTETNGNVAAVARAMGKGRMQIHRWAQRFGLQLDSYRH